MPIAKQLKKDLTALGKIPGTLLVLVNYLLKDLVYRFWGLLVLPKNLKVAPKTKIKEHPCSIFLLNSKITIENMNQSL